MIVVALLKRLVEDRYAEIKLSKKDQSAFGIDVYPKTLNEAYNLLENHSTSRNLHPRRKSKIPKDREEEEKAIIKSKDEDLQGM